MRSAMLLAMLALGGCAAQSARTVEAAAEPATALRGRLIDGTGAAPVEDGVVVIRGDSIACAGAAAACTIPSGARTIDAEGGTILPGLIDLHAHVWDAGMLSMFLPAGVTTVRDLHNTFENLALLDTVTAPRPRLLRAGPLIDGRQSWPGATVAADVSAAERAVDTVAAHNVDVVKLYSGLSMEQVAAATAPRSPSTAFPAPPASPSSCLQRARDHPASCRGNVSPSTQSTQRKKESTQRTHCLSSAYSLFYSACSAFKCCSVPSREVREHTMRVLIVDDEPAARRRLALMLEELDEEVVGQAANGMEALEMVRERRPELVLLDVEMPEIDGFDVLRHLGDPRPLVVFQTAYDEYALRAFEHAALDYLVKPVTRAGLERALARARERLAAPSLSALDEQVAQALRSAAGVAAPRRRRLLVREGRGHRLVALDEVVRFSAEEGVSHAHLAAGTRHLTDYTLAELEARAGDAFVRVSRADLVRLDAVARVTRNGDGSATLGLSDGSTVHVSRRRAPDVWALLEG